MLPNFLIIGAPKCGTSSLYYKLGEHPQIFMSKVKEPHFFGRNDVTKTLEWYENHFLESNGKIAIGEGSTSYTHPHIINQASSEIAHLLPRVRLIYLVRNPIKRIESDWKMRKREGWAQGNFNEAIKRQETLVGHGMYWKNISVYRKIFPDSQILILFLEDFMNNFQEELKKCFIFLGVNSKVSITDSGQSRNVATQYRKDSFVLEYFRKTKNFDHFKRILPPLIFNFAKSLFTQKFNYNTKWDPDIKYEVTKKFKNDSQMLLQHCGKNINFWNFR